MIRKNQGFSLWTSLGLKIIKLVKGIDQSIEITYRIRNSFAHSEAKKSPRDKIYTFPSHLNLSLPESVEKFEIGQNFGPGGGGPKFELG